MSIGNAPAGRTTLLYERDPEYDSFDVKVWLASGPLAGTFGWRWQVIHTTNDSIQEVVDSMLRPLPSRGDARREAMAALANHLIERDWENSE